MRKMISGLAMILLGGLIMVGCPEIPKIEVLPPPEKQTQSVLLQYNKDLILCDRDFEFNNGLTGEQIQDLLEKRNSFLKDYIDPTTGKPTSWVIADRAQYYQISSKVLLAKIQQESSGVWSYQNLNDLKIFRGQILGTKVEWILSYGLPDPPTEVQPQFKGFYNQVDNAAKSLSEWFLNSDIKGWQIGRPHVVDNGEKTVIPANRATISLYIYTPWIESNKLFYNVWLMMFGFIEACEPIISIPSATTTFIPRTTSTLTPTSLPTAVPTATRAAVPTKISVFPQTPLPAARATATTTATPVSSPTVTPKPALSIKWETKITNTGINRMLISETDLFASSFDGYVYGLNLQNGKTKTKQKISGAPVKILKLDSGETIVLCADTNLKSFRAYNVTTGQLLWEYRPTTNKFMNFFVGAEKDKAYLTIRFWQSNAVMTYELHVLDIKTGELKEILPWPIIAGKNESCDIQNDTAYCSSDLGARSFNYKTGEQKWTNPAIGSRAFVQLRKIHKNTFYLWFGPDLYALDESTGALKWTYRNPGTESIIVATATDDTIYIGGRSRRISDFISALNSVNGNVKWTSKRNWFALALAASQNKLYVGTDNGWIIAAEH